MKVSGTLAVGLAVCMVLTLAVEENGHHPDAEIRDVQKIQEPSEKQNPSGDLVESETQTHDNGDQDLEEPPLRRSRLRNGGGKRRRRMRKKPRTTTQLPPAVEESFEATHYMEQQHFEPQYNRPRRLHIEESPFEEQVSLPRRRPGKRRRRPFRRHHDRERTDYSDDRLRDLAEEEVPRRRRKGGRKRPRLPVNPIQEETTTILNTEYNPDQEMITQQYIPETSAHKLRIDIDHTDEPVATTQTNSEINSESTTISTEHELMQELDLNRTNSPKPETVETTVSPVALTEFEQKIENEIIFDRKTLFPTSKRLPPTSALIRRMLRPKSAGEGDSNETRNEIIPNSLLPQGYTVSPEVISPAELVNVWRSHMNGETTEEPNYPKVLPEQMKIIKSKKTSDNPTISTEALTELTSDDSTEKLIPEETTMHQRMEETLKYKALDIPNVKDDILDLLKSESGSSRLAKILELRNMTLVDLIAHRERGSSQFHLSEIFKKTQESATHEETRQTIEFPNEDILGSFPKFLLEQISKSLNLHDNETEESGETTTMRTESRGSRAFKSEKKDKILKIPPYPTWKVVPNPKLTPVSVLGQYEEIYLTKFRPTPPQETNEITLPADENPHPYTKNDITAESVKTRSPPQVTTFRRIPPGMKSAIIVSGGILVLAIFGFLSVLISCRVRQRRARLRAKRDILCQHLQNEEFMNSQRSLSPVLTKTQREPVFTQGIHSNTTSNRHYYLWRTLRKTFQYD